jgi:hypothetical protein
MSRTINPPAETAVEGLGTRSFQLLPKLESPEGRVMADMRQLDRTYNYILETFIKRGDAPHFTEIAREFSVNPDEGKRFLHELMALPLPIWLYPKTDLIASFAPFNNLPTQYRITVEGQQKWFAQ